MKKLSKLVASVAFSVGLLGVSTTAHAADNHYVVKHNSFVYNSKLKKVNLYKKVAGKKYTSTTYRVGTTLTADNVKTIKGKKYYQIGNNKFVRTSNLQTFADYLKKNKNKVVMPDLDETDSDAQGNLTDSGLKKVAENNQKDTTIYHREDSKMKSKLLSKAKNLFGAFHYGNHLGFGNWASPNRKGTTDCSGFVWIAMKQAGYNVSEKAFATPTMESDARINHQYFTKISASKAKAGDVMIVNVGNGLYSNGHAAILTGNYHGLATPIIQMGGNGNSVNYSTLGPSLGQTLLGGRFTYARPVMSYQKDQN
ncbi:hypothetical protein FP435_04330 [Lactobacillus sp. PV037]|uniref:NlpC/P60 family protein n=1 Tax=Lactobacillus sp. PV037 TaxID=2594496 RepID=UPI00223EF375|nr:NlpC/P60 family protein [Lactobacillus sp. PV037]QNQ83724.1 hypothetical protein FP435_04330 [Lactobacillus sp. PV037]